MTEEELATESTVRPMAATKEKQFNHRTARNCLEQHSRNQKSPESRGLCPPFEDEGGQKS